MIGYGKDEFARGALGLFAGIGFGYAYLLAAVFTFQLERNGLGRDDKYGFTLRAFAPLAGMLVLNLDFMTTVFAAKSYHDDNFHTSQFSFSRFTQ